MSKPLSEYTDSDLETELKVMLVAVNGDEFIPELVKEIKRRPELYNRLLKEADDEAERAQQTETEEGPIL